MNVNANAIMTLVANQLPRELHPSVLLVGSLAAAYHYRARIGASVRTKDADVVIQPAGALATCREVAIRLLNEGWRRTDKCYGMPTGTPVDSLRAVRLHPPSSEAYFVELLGLPALTQTSSKEWAAIELDDGLLYGVPCFRFMGLFEHAQQRSAQGLAYPHPAMMALANALSHPIIGTDTMSEKIEGREILRSAKDLGRVLALAYLEEPQALETWSELWREALNARFAEGWREFARVAGAGVRALLLDEVALEQAHHTVSQGLLVGRDVKVGQLRAVGEQLLALAFEPLEAASHGD